MDDCRTCDRVTELADLELLVVISSDNGFSNLRQEHRRYKFMSGQDAQRPLLP